MGKDELFGWKYMFELLVRYGLFVCLTKYVRWTTNNRNLTLDLPERKLSAY